MRQTAGPEYGSLVTLCVREFGGRDSDLFVRRVEDSVETLEEGVAVYHGGQKGNVTDVNLQIADVLMKSIP